MSVATLDTPHGPARVRLHPAEDPRAALVLGHGAGGGIAAPDLVTVTRVALESDVSVALVEQPYRVAGRRSPPRAPNLDAAWTAVVEHLRADALQGLPVVVGGRSSGARVACRTATATDAAGVLCLAFPLQPPPRRSGSESPSRIGELDGVGVPVLVVQGEGDRFGIPAPAGLREVVRVHGNHSLRSDLPAVSAAIAHWLRGVLRVDSDRKGGQNSIRRSG